MLLFQGLSTKQTKTKKMEKLFLQKFKKKYLDIYVVIDKWN